MQTKTVFSFASETREYCGTAVAHENPRRPGTYLLPAFTMEKAPPETGERETARANEAGDDWEVVPDWRGYVYWLADGSRQEITEIGIAPPADALDEEPLPPLSEARARRIEGIKREAHSLLAPSDWYVIRRHETGEQIPDAIAAYRAAVRAASDAAEGEVAVMTDVAAVLAYQPVWPAGQ